jgi:carbonic anhydrase
MATDRSRDYVTPHRRTRWLVTAALTMLVALAPWTASHAGSTHSAGTTSGAAPSASEVIAELKAGNQHHVKTQYLHPHETAARRRELTGGQHPHAVVLTCSDSRVPPELVFDQGLGDLFTIRVAGNVATDSEIASIEYAVEHLHTPLVVVMGHQSCGAVGAAIEGGKPPGHLGTLVDAIRPAVERARKMPGNLSDNAIRINVEMVVEQLRASRPVLAEAVASGKVKIVGAVYALDTGVVTWSPEKIHS